MKEHRHARTVAPSTGFARGLERALGLETVKLEQPVRVAGTSWLLSPRRLEIVLTAAAYPGVHLRSASRLLLSPLPSLRFHVERLAAEGLVRTRRLGNRVALFLPRQFPARMEPFLGVWQDPLDRRVLQLIRGHPGIARAALGRQVVPDSGFLERSLARLRRCGAIRSRGRKGAWRYWTTAAWKRFERYCRNNTSSRLQTLLGILDAQGLRPFIEEMSTDHVRVSVDGPRSRIRFALPLNPLNLLQGT